MTAPQARRERAEQAAIKWRGEHFGRKEYEWMNGPLISLLLTFAAQEAEQASAQARRVLKVLSVGQNGLCWQRYGCFDGQHDDLCLMAYAALRAAPPSGGETG